jgi:hypothetical protein
VYFTSQKRGAELNSEGTLNPYIVVHYASTVSLAHSSRLDDMGIQGCDHVME